MCLLLYRYRKQTGKSIRDNIVSTTQDNLLVHFILSTVMSNNQFSLEWCPWSTKSSYILNAREINVHYISGFIHGAIIIIPSGFIIYAKTLIYLGVHHPNKYEKKAARLWLRERYIPLIICDNGIPNG